MNGTDLQNSENLKSSEELSQEVKQLQGQIKRYEILEAMSDEANFRATLLATLSEKETIQIDLIKELKEITRKLGSLAQMTFETNKMIAKQVGVLKE